MAKGEQYEARVEAWIAPVLEQHQFELVDVEYVREVGVWYLRCYIDKEGGITVDDCEVISRLLGEWLDKEDFIEDSYILEVSSPGLGRPLKKEKDFARSTAKMWRSACIKRSTNRRNLQERLRPMTQIL